MITHDNPAADLLCVATSRKKVTKSKGKATSGRSKGQSMMKKRPSRARQTKKVKKTARASPSDTRSAGASSTKTQKIEDSGAVRKARSLDENIVEDAQKTVDETTDR